VSGLHAHALTVHGHSPVHTLPARVKLASMVAFILAVVATPREQMWAFAVHALLVVAVITIAELPFGHVLKRVGVEVPFVIFAVFLPFLGSGPTTQFLGMELSREGLWGAWNILAKGTLGVTASVILVSTTEVTAILRGMADLKVPASMVAIAGFMVRYLEVIAGELRRMKVAMAARGYDPTWIGQTRALATAGGALFIRSYERGERVHQAMLARGFSGVMPRIRPTAAGGAAWALGLSVPLAAWMITGVSLL
jgi:cobalt/nickel transport system permease protein